MNSQHTHLIECESTNEVAWQLIRQGVPDGHCVTADAQIQGRGRRGRNWITLPGALALSYIARPQKLRAQDASRLVLLAAVCVREALASLGVDTFVKWPNDILIASHDGIKDQKLGSFRKLAGILVELSTADGWVNAAVVGIGVNIGPDVAAVSGMGAASVSDVCFGVDRHILLAEIVPRLKEAFLSAHDSERFAQMLDLARSYSCMIGRRIRIQDGVGVLEAQVVDLNKDGALMVALADGRTQVLYTGDVHFIDA